MSGSRGSWLVLGVSGVTCGGKTTLAVKLNELLVPSYLFSQDQYFYPDDSPNHVKCEGLDHNNYDILSSLDMDRMYADILSTMDGDDKSLTRNTTRKVGAVELPGKNIMIVEGFTVLNYKPIMELCDYRYYFVLEYAECALRRSFRLYEPPDVEGYFDRCVWPEHVKYRAEIEKDHRVVILDGAQRDVCDLVLGDLRKFGAKDIS